MFTVTYRVSKVWTQHCFSLVLTRADIGVDPGGPGPPFCGLHVQYQVICDVTAGAWGKKF